jgi:hypothetical protein
MFDLSRICQQYTGRRIVLFLMGDNPRRELYGYILSMAVSCPGYGISFWLKDHRPSCIDHRSFLSAQPASFSRSTISRNGNLKIARAFILLPLIN